MHHHYTQHISTPPSTAIAMTMSPLYDEPDKVEFHSSAKSDVVPVVDLTAPAAASVLRRACETWGVFQLIGHGVPAHVIEKLDAQARRLFSLPLNEKVKVARPRGGMSGYGTVPVWDNSTFEKQVLCEGFTVTSSIHDLASRLWPEHPNQFSDAIEEYLKEMKQLSRKLLNLMILSLGCTEEAVRQTNRIGAGCELMQMNWYPNAREPGQDVGMAVHTDSSLFAVLYQDGGPSGLQVKRGDDQYGSARWVTVHPIPGALVIHVGDLGHIISNGRFHNVVHRAVIVDRDQPRLSVVYGFGPADNVKVSPVVGGEFTGVLQRYRAVTWTEFRELKARYEDKVYAAIRVCEEDGSGGATGTGGATVQNTGIAAGESMRSS